MSPASSTSAPVRPPRRPTPQRARRAPGRPGVRQASSPTTWSRATWTAGRSGWHDARVEPYGPITLDPATAVLHYAQEIFEGLKAYRHADGSVWTFRPEANAARLARSARRLAMPELPRATFLGVDRGAGARRRRLGAAPAARSSLYLRPFMYRHRGVPRRAPGRTSTSSCVIASPAGAYFPGGVKPVSIWLSQEYTRAAPAAPARPSAAATTRPRWSPQPGRRRTAATRCCFLDAVEQQLGRGDGRHEPVLRVRQDGRLVTPELTGTHPGRGHPRLDPHPGPGARAARSRSAGSTIDEWRDGLRRRRDHRGVRLRHRGRDHPGRPAAAGTAGSSSSPTASRRGDHAGCASALIDIQYGRARRPARLDAPARLTAAPSRRRLGAESRHVPARLLVGRNMEDVTPSPWQRLQARRGAACRIRSAGSGWLCVGELLVVVGVVLLVLPGPGIPLIIVRAGRPGRRVRLGPAHPGPGQGRRRSLGQGCATGGAVAVARDAGPPVCVGPPALAPARAGLPGRQAVADWSHHDRRDDHYRQARRHRLRQIQPGTVDAQTLRIREGSFSCRERRPAGPDPDASGDPEP